MFNSTVYDVKTMPVTIIKAVHASSLGIVLVVSKSYIGSMLIGVLTIAAETQDTCMYLNIPLCK